MCVLPHVRGTGKTHIRWLAVDVPVLIRDLWPSSPDRLRAFLASKRTFVCAGEWETVFPHFRVFRSALEEISRSQYIPPDHGRPVTLETVRRKRKSDSPIPLQSKPYGGHALLRFSRSLRLRIYIDFLFRLIYFMCISAKWKVKRKTKRLSNCETKQCETLCLWKCT